LISDEDVDDTSTTFDNIGLLFITIDGIDGFEEFGWDGNKSIEDEESDNCRGVGGGGGGGGANG
jgi:hypothetical protein